MNTIYFVISFLMVIVITASLYKYISLRSSHKTLKSRLKNLENKINGFHRRAQSAESESQKAISNIIDYLHLADKKVKAAEYKSIKWHAKYSEALNNYIYTLDNFARVVNHFELDEFSEAAAADMLMLKFNSKSKTLSAYKRLAKKYRQELKLLKSNQSVKPTKLKKQTKKTIKSKSGKKIQNKKDKLKIKKSFLK